MWTDLQKVDYSTDAEHAKSKEIETGRKETGTFGGCPNIVVKFAILIESGPEHQRRERLAVK